MATQASSHVAAAAPPPLTDESDLIVASGLTKRYGDFTAVDNLHLTIRRGEIFGLLGPNGAGKTTTILMLLGLTQPTAGTVRVMGQDPVRNPLGVKVTGRQNLRYTASLNRLRGKEAEDLIGSLLEEVGLAHAADKRASTYSRGMRQRLAVADALVKRPSILILDEPTIGIDPEGVRDMLALLERLRDEEGMTILLSSHLLYQVQAICDRVGIFVGGRLIAAGPVAELEKQLARDDDTEIELTVLDSDGAPPSAERLARLAGSMQALDGVNEVRPSTEGLNIRGHRDVRPAVAGTVVAEGLLPVHMRQRGLSLDDIYDRYFREEVDARGTSA